MTEFATRALLPAGLRDILPPQAAHEADVVTRLMASFAAQGYERVKPPLIEFEESLLEGSGAAMSKHTFRVMDPVTQRMMGVRADMTPQVARIATTRLANARRPLRLSYAGQVLRVKGSQLRPERQFGQAGIELIGADSAAADAEVVILAAKALVDLGVGEVCVDLTLPSLVPEICSGLDEIDGLKDALDHKDVAAVAAVGGAIGPILCGLVEAAGPAVPALARLSAVPLSGNAAALRERLTAVVELVSSAAPELTLTIDPVEGRGFEYHTGPAFTIFARQSAAELGRGGRYQADGESAAGATLFMDTVLDVLPGPVAVRRIFLPFGTPFAEGQALRAEGWVTVAGLEKVADDRAESRRLACGHLLVAGGVIAA
ncbi:ATP phosphoribosyltransferase regulatory subunit [Telmatospirillum siberiense]|uniref:ATP phosphoribosyltransferase regulatory subunit n=1 Tax=Telmatospirillum siberiense TaxID=382514 RepID=A0A2N3Q1I0_9PROT|nr:ATP phosphoribosyltransferase regulatory subunit [Telmatospirillum siberiense]PKU26451.1 ATP phosphoribosyltransferase regulatory subunit [Telmatospirillum siberiense]